MSFRIPIAALSFLSSTVLCAAVHGQGIGQEISIPTHFVDGEEFQVPLPDVVEHGRNLFAANWTVQEGGGRPRTNGAGGALADPNDPLLFPRAFNRLSAPDANSCFGCHNAPLGVVGGGGDYTASVFVLAQRFDFTTFDHSDLTPKKGAVDEAGKFVDQLTVANVRASLGMFGSGYIEMLARQMTEDLQSIRDTLQPGASQSLVCKGVDFGVLARDAAGLWDVSGVTGLGALSLGTNGGTTPPNLIVRPFHQAGAVVSLRQFSNNAYNHHHGIQTVERFGAGDPDTDGFTDEMTTADVTAVSVFQAALAVPGRVISTDPKVERAVRAGEELFVSAGCVECHVPCLPLDQAGWVYSEPNPYNPTGNLLPGDAYVQVHGTFEVDLSDSSLPQPRIEPANGLAHVHAFTDLKLHDITSGPNDPNREALDMHLPPTSPGFFLGNSRFLTRKLWGAANEPPYFHHGQYTTMRQAIEAHAGEAATSQAAYQALAPSEQDAIIEFLKTLQVLPPGTTSLVVDQDGNPRDWPRFPYPCNQP
ncbi:MAG TPA: di-heme oxidoredictase family protein [Planctomycetota bacterium]|nr:di-heme oxidoredictase family protein [Planctomycetota bacterium]